MRRAGPILILLIGVARPGRSTSSRASSCPTSASADGAWRTVETKLGLDLAGGLRVEYQALPVDGKSPTPGDMCVIKDIVERRVNTTGVSEPLVTTQGSDRVVVELPGVTDPEAVRKLVGQTGRLDFVPLGSTDRRPQGQILDLEASTRRCSVATRSQSATVGTDQNGRPARRLRAQVRRRPAVRRLHRRPRRRLLRDHPRRRRSSPRRSSRTPSPTATSRSPAAGSAASRPRTPTTS